MYVVAKKMRTRPEGLIENVKKKWGDFVTSVKDKGLNLQYWESL